MNLQGFTSLKDFLWEVIKPYKYNYLVMLSAAWIGGFYDFANNYAIKLVVDAFSNEGSPNLFFPIALFIFAQFMLDAVWRTSDVAQWRSEPYVRKDILCKVYDHVQHNSYQFFQNTPSGTIISQIKGILDGYDNCWSSLHHDFLPRLANTVILTATLAIVDVKICFWITIWAICLFIVMFYFSSVIDKLSFINSNHRHRILGLFADNVTNIFTIFSFATRNFERNKLENAIDKDFVPSNIRIYKFTFLSYLIGAVFYWVMLIGLFLYMIDRRQSGLATTGDLVFVMSIVIKMGFELWNLIQRIQIFMKQLGDFKSAFALLRIPCDPKEIAALPKLYVEKPSIVFDQVVFAHPGRPMFEGLSLSIRAGEKVGLVGSSGAGKSTMVSLLLRYLDPSSGQILIDDHNISDCSVDSVRQNIALIPQDILLFHRSIYENIRYGRLNATKDEVIAAARIANIHDIIETLPEGYDTEVGERGVKLSGGQRQRIAIARAILKNAPILILDEATSALDTVTESLIQNSLMRILHNSSTTVLAIAHRLSTVKHLDRIIVLEQGRIIDQGSHEVLIKKSALYQKLWDMQKL
jgi:ATP-binding cassette subfamily B protein